MPHRRALLAGIGAASTSLAGCNYLFGDGEATQQRAVPGDWTPGPGEWVGPAYDQANSGHNPHASPPRSEPTVDWEVDVNQASVLVADGTVFLRESTALHGLATDDGTERFEASRPSGALFRYVDGRLYDSILDGIEALTLEGEAEWDGAIEYDDRIMGFVERDGYLYLSNQSDTIHCHDADSGERVDATVHDTGVGGLANHDGVLYAALEDALVAYDVADDGSLEELWRYGLGDGDDPNPFSVAVQGERAWVVQERDRANSQSGVSLFDVESEEHLGTIELDAPASVSAIGEYTYLTRGSDPTRGDILAYEGTEEQWVVELEPGPAWTVLAGGTLYVGRGGREAPSLTALDAESGDELWTYEGAFPQAVVGETIYATTGDDRFVALRE